MNSVGPQLSPPNPAAGDGEETAESPLRRATERIQALIDSAEAEAGEIIARAEADAGEYVRRVRLLSDREAIDHAQAMAALSRSLIAQAEVLSRESSRLLAALNGGDDSGDFPRGARLLATQMAVSGSDRDEIRDRLVNDFGMADAEPLLDTILGK